VAGSSWVNHLNDLGNFVLASVMIWAYFSFSQFLIIWSANLPEEAAWYDHRSHGGWQWVGMLLVAFQFVLPFLLLLSRRVKRKASLLTAVAVLLLVMRLVDLFWLIVPAFYPEGFHLHWLDLTLFVAVGGGWLAIFIRELAAKPLLPLRDPQLEEFVSHEQREEVAA
jgi:hypothetical protein